MAVSKTLKPRIFWDDQQGMGLKFSSLIAAFLILLAAVLAYVWSHIHFTELKYSIARDVSVQERLIGENRKLKVEIATLKSPQRIEAIARDRLGMQLPEREQVIFLK